MRNRWDMLTAWKECMGAPDEILRSEWRVRREQWTALEVIGSQCPMEEQRIRLLRPQ